MRKLGESGSDPEHGIDVRAQESGSGSRDTRRQAMGGRIPTTPSPDLLGDQGELNDAWLVERARHGDQRAFGVLVTRYERKLIGVLSRLVGDVEQARDLSQETFWRIYQRLDRFDSSRRFGPWLFRIGVNLALDWLRRARVETLSLSGQGRRDGHGLDPASPDPRKRAELVQEVQFILSRMPASERTILVLRDLEGFSTSEVAAIVGRKEPTVRWRLALARQRFRDQWQGRQDGRIGQPMDGEAKCGSNDE